MKKRHYLRRSLSFIISMLMILTLTPATSFAASVDYSSLLSSSWTEDQDFRLADPAPQ